TQIHVEKEARIEQPGRIFSPLEIAAHPEECIGNAAKHRGGGWRVMGGGKNDRMQRKLHPAPLNRQKMFLGSFQALPALAQPSLFAVPPPPPTPPPPPCTPPVTRHHSAPTYPYFRPLASC